MNKPYKRRASQNNTFPALSLKKCIKKMDEKIESNVQQFIHWLEVEKKKNTEKME